MIRTNSGLLDHVRSVRSNLANTKYQEARRKAAAEFMARKEVKVAVRSLVSVGWATDAKDVELMLAGVGRASSSTLGAQYRDALSAVERVPSNPQQEVLLTVALQTTHLKIWTDIHGPLGAFLDALKAAKTVEECDAAISKFLVDLE